MQDISISTSSTTATTTTTSAPRKVCFSFAAYAKTVIEGLRSSDVHVTAGLTAAEFAAVEATADVTFPPDLRSILSEGLPVGPGFPNWRSSSRQQLRLLLSLSSLAIMREVSRSNFWVSSSWGPRPEDGDRALAVAREFLGSKRVPALVPVYKNCYVPAEPNLAGNPVFYVNGGEVRLLSVDVGGFFREMKSWRKGVVFRRESKAAEVPAWAKVARRVEFWSDLAARGNTLRWWWSGELGGCLEDVMWRLLDGGWDEDEVREMMMVDGNDEGVMGTRGGRRVGEVRDREGVARHVRNLSRELLRGGWSIDDVVYSLGDHGDVESGILDGESWVDMHCPVDSQITLLMSR